MNYKARAARVAVAVTALIGSVLVSGSEVSASDPTINCTSNPKITYRHKYVNPNYLTGQSVLTPNGILIVSTDVMTRPGSTGWWNTDWVTEWDPYSGGQFRFQFQMYMSSGASSGWNQFQVGWCNY